LPASEVASDERIALPQGWGFWTAGAITSGERDPRTNSIGFDFQSDGVTFGLDRVFADQVVLGLAGGFGWDETRFASSSRQDADQRALTAYGLWRAGEYVYFEGILGAGRLEWDISRWSEVAGAHATARRDGDQTYGSLAIGMEHVTDKMKLAGYARYEGSRTELDAYAEQGLGIYDLTYGAQSIDSRTIAVGVEGSHWMQGASIAFRPYWLLEYREALQDESEVAINYVIRPVASDYVLGLRSYNDDAFVFGAGVDMQLFRGWTLSLLYRHEQANGAVGSNTFGLQFAWRPEAAPPAATMVPTSGVNLGSAPSP
jgi:outer membrane autotransporter protein